MKTERADLRVKRHPDHGYEWGIWLDYDSPDSAYSGRADDEDAAVEAGRECARRRGLDVEPNAYGRAEAREPAYGSAARRYQAERELGVRVVEILRSPADSMPESRCEHVTGLDVRHLEAVAVAARSLGLLGEQEEAKP